MLVDRRKEVECVLNSNGYPIVYYSTYRYSFNYCDLFSADTPDEQIFSLLSLHIRDVYKCDCLFITIKYVCSYDAKIK